jgi:hypothetical protein
VTPRDVLLVLGATMRLTRLITNDKLGEWWVKDPLDVWLHGHESEATPEQVSLRAAERQPWRKYAEGLECPHCVGFHVGWMVMASYLLARRSPTALKAWKFVAGSLTLNTVVVALGDKAGYWE